jgi:hypothetical protein
MAIEIYDKARIVKKDDVFFYFLKNGSKNCFICPFQSIIDNNFNNKFIRRQSRESNWHLIAIGDNEAVKQNKIADTHWNAPTSSYYGRIAFGNHKNIALFFAKSRVWNYDLLSETQKINIDHEIKYYVNEEKMEWTIDLRKPLEDKNRMKEKIEYCGKEFNLAENCLEYAGKKYWDLDNL